MLTHTDGKLANSSNQTNQLRYPTQIHGEGNNDTKAAFYDTRTRVSCLTAKDSMFPVVRPEEEAAQPGDTLLTGSERAV